MLTFKAMVKFSMIVGIVALSCSSVMFWNPIARSFWPISNVYRAFEKSLGRARTPLQNEVFPKANNKKFQQSFHKRTCIRLVLIPSVW